jgi:hypothetical protein
LIAWLAIVRVDELVKDGPKGRRLRRSLILDKLINTNKDAVQAIKAAFSIGGELFHLQRCSELTAQRCAKRC